MDSRFRLVVLILSLWSLNPLFVPRPYRLSRIQSAVIQAIAIPLDTNMHNAHATFSHSYTPNHFLRQQPAIPLLDRNGWYEAYWSSAYKRIQTALEKGVCPAAGITGGRAGRGRDVGVGELTWGLSHSSTLSYSFPLLFTLSQCLVPLPR